LWIRTPSGSSSSSNVTPPHTSRSGPRNPLGQPRAWVNLSLSCPLAGALRFCPCRA
jgi:hypothetical protein